MVINELCRRKTCPDMVLLTLCYYYRGPLVFATYDPTGMLRMSRCVQIFYFQTYQYMYNTSTAAAAVSSTKCSSSEWSIKALEAIEMK